MNANEWKKEIKFTKGERGALVILILLIALSYVYSFWYKPQIILDENHYRIEDLLTDYADNNNAKWKERNREKYINKANQWRNPKAKQKRQYPKAIYEPFNPNEIDSLKWLQLGVKPWTIKSIMKYKAKGGQFKKCSDINSIYNMDDSIKRNIIPHCNIPVKIKKTTFSSSKNKTAFKSTKSPKSTVPKLLKPFDPNTIDSMEWLALGVKPWTIKSIMKYKKMGGSYSSCDDLNNIFNMDQSTKDELIPYCAIKLIPIDINQADTTALKKIKGIGPATARSIVDYRTRLGGFINKEQLLEAWGINLEIFQDINERIIITGKTTPLNINGDLEPLARHPYIKDYKLAKIIVNYRRQHGDFENISDLKKVRVLSDSVYERLVPYLSLQ